MNTLIIYKSGEVKHATANQDFIRRDENKGLISHIISIEKPLEPRILIKDVWIKIPPLV